MTPNPHKVPLKKWRKWSDTARRAFNDIYPKAPGTKGGPLEHHLLERSVARGGCGGRHLPPARGHRGSGATA